MRKFILGDLKLAGIDLTSLGSEMRLDCNIKIHSVGLLN